MKFTRIPRKRDLHKKRVAAYCRVSTLLEEQEDSFETQVSYYKAFIEANDEWEFAGIYSDEKSGTKAENRPGFQKLVRDALDGKVDYILCKSISRFSRNIVDCQKYVKLLHGNGVDVKFEKENLDTASPSCSMMLSFLSAIAQDESRSISENVRWAYRERFKRGDYGVRTRKGTLISHNDILYILKNETYRGDKLLQKQPPKDFLTKKPDKRAHYESYYLEGDHEAIVEPVMWDAVQEKLKQKKEIESAVGHRGGQPHFLYGLIFCDECGAPMTRRTLKAYDGSSYKAWTCRERHKGRKGNGCTCRTIRETDLIAAICVQMGWEQVAEEKLTEIERVLVSEDGVEIVKMAKAS